MTVLLQTLYVQHDGAVARLDHDTVWVTTEQGTLARIPLHLVQSIVAFGRVSLTSPLLERCARDGKSVVKLDNRGRFLFRLEGPVTGNVLLRTAQYELWRQTPRQIPLVQAFVAGKLHNARVVLQRAARDAHTSETAERLRTVAAELLRDLRRLPHIQDLAVLRGVEGVNARRYFSVWNLLLTEHFDLPSGWTGRSRRPPLDPINAVLSLLYGLLRHDVQSALESVGLDPQVGYLHTLRPGRPGLALDLMEEFRPVLADRVALTLLNRRQLQAADFETLPGGAVELTPQGRKTVLAEYQRRKQTEVQHPLLSQSIPLGQVMMVQARLLARAIRQDHAVYTPYCHRG
ncbi:MAG: type I-C CRISPR-associated endonuclease Cas1c [Alicyclobacillus sp.]|nr:type I-C CRISPR-associated endonuclease Cas1c [Alicyclobacillus sp.]